MRRVLVAVLLALGIHAGPASAEELDETTRASVRKLGYEGIEHFQRQEYAQALDKLDRSYRLLPVPTLGLWSARALKQQGRWVAASERYFDVMRLPLPELEREVHEKAQAEAKAEREALEPRIPRLTAKLPAGVAPNTIALRIDDRPIASELIGAALPLDPGEHRLVVQRGDAEAELTVNLEPDTSVTRMLQVPPAPVEPRPAPTPVVSPPPAVPVPPSAPLPLVRDDAQPMLTAGWSLVGVGGASFLVGLGMGIYMAAERSRLDCEDDVCASTEADRVDRLNDLRFPTTGLLIAGGVVAAVGVTLVLVTPDDDADPTLEANLAGTRAHLMLRF